MRLTGLDLARFCAFAGMVLVNFRIAAGAIPDSSVAHLIIANLEGRAAALFVILAGIGLSMGRPSTRSLLIRAGFLFALGLLNLMVFEADILHFYALYFLCAIPLLRWRSGPLLLISLALIVLAPLLALGFDYNAGWNWDILHYDGFWTVTGFLRHSFYNGWHPVVPWLAFLLIGLCLGRLPLGNPTTQWALLLMGGLGAFLSAQSASWLAAHNPAFAPLLGTSPIPPGPFYVITASLTAVAALGACLITAPILERLRVLHWLAAPGRQALTLYLAHILIGMGVMEELGWLNGHLSASAVMLCAFGFLILSSIFAVFWERFFRRGPLESVMRAIS